MDKTNTVNIIYRLVDEASAALQNIKQEMKDVDNAAKSNDKNTKKSESGFKKLAKAVGGAALAYKALSFGLSSIEAYKTQEQASKRLEAIAYGVTKATKAQVESLKLLADQTQLNTTYGDELVEAGMSQIMSFGTTVEQTKALTGSLTDLLAATKGTTATTDDAINAANMLGKALSGQAGALSRAGIIMTDYQAEMIKNGDQQERVNTLIEVMNSNYGGLAATMKDSLSGALVDNKNQYGDIQEEIGEKLIPVQIKFVELQIAGAKAALVVVDGLSKLVNVAKVFSPVLAAVGVNLAIQNAHLMKSSGLWVINAIKTGIATVAQTGFNLALSLTPWGLAAAGLAAATAGLLKWADNIEKAAEAQVKFAQASQETTRHTKQQLDRMNELNDKTKQGIKLTKDEKAELKGLKKEIKETTGGTVKYNRALGEYEIKLNGAVMRTSDLTKKMQGNWFSATADDIKLVNDKMTRYQELANLGATATDDQKKEMEELKTTIEGATGATLDYNAETQKTGLIFQSVDGGTFVKTLEEVNKTLDEKTKKEREAAAAAKAKAEAEQKAADAEKARVEREKRALEELRRQREQATKIAEELRLQQLQSTMDAETKEKDIINRSYDEKKKVLLKKYKEGSEELAILEEERQRELQEIDTKYADEATQAQLEKDKEKKEALKSTLEEMLAEKTAMYLQSNADNLQVMEEYYLKQEEMAYNSRIKELEANGATQAMIEEAERIHQQNIANIKDEYATQEEEKRLQHIAKEYDDRQKLQDTIMQDAHQTFAITSKFVDMAAAKKIEDVKNSSKSEEEKQKAIEKIQKDAAKKKYSIAMFDWGTQLVGATVDTARAVSKTLASVPYPASIPLAIAAGVQGAIQVGTIASNKPKKPRLREGGDLKGGSTNTDDVLFYGNAGEKVIDKSRSRKLNKAIDNNQLGQSLNLSISAPITINGTDEQAQNQFVSLSNQFIDKVVGAVETAYSQRKFEPSRIPAFFGDSYAQESY